MDENKTTTATTERETLPRLISTTQAAAILNCHPRTIARMCEKGTIKAIRVQSMWRINRDALMDYAGLN